VFYVFTIFSFTIVYAQRAYIQNIVFKGFTNKKGGDICIIDLTHGYFRAFWFNDVDVSVRVGGRRTCVSFELWVATSDCSARMAASCYE